jgi:hypothetical protein
MQSGNYRGIDGACGLDACRESGELGCESRHNCFVLLRLNRICTAVYIQCSNLRRTIEEKVKAEMASAPAPRMPFARPETALASTIDSKLGSKVVRGKTMRPAACQNASTTFQRLPRRLNDLQKSASARHRRPLNPAGLRHHAVGTCHGLIASIIRFVVKCRDAPPLAQSVELSIERGRCFPKEAVPTPGAGLVLPLLGEQRR